MERGHLNFVSGVSEQPGRAQEQLRGGGPGECEEEGPAPKVILFYQPPGRQQRRDRLAATWPTQYENTILLALVDLPLGADQIIGAEGH